LTTINDFAILKKDMTSTSFSLDIGEKYIKIGQVIKKGNLIETTALAYEESGYNIYLTEADKPHQSTLQVISQLMNDSGIKKKSINIIIPDGRSYSRIIEMPLLTDRELSSAIKYQADQFIPIPIDKVNLDVEVLLTDKKNKKSLILLVAAASSVVDKVVNIAESVGLLPERIENESSGTFKLLSYLNPIFKSKTAKTGSLFLIMNFGFSSTSLYIYDATRDLPLDIHNFAIGYELMAKSIKNNYNISDSEVKNLIETIGLGSQSGTYDLSQVLASAYSELVSEIEKFIVSAKSKFGLPISEINYFGEGFKLKDLHQKLSGSLGIKTELIDIYGNLSKNNVSDFFKADLPLFVPILGSEII